MRQYTLMLHVTLGVVLGLAVPERSAGQEAKGLLGYWPFDEGQGDLVTDRSDNNNDGDIWGAEWVKGKFGIALHFNGEDSYVSIPQIDNLDGSNELTVEAWVYWEGSGRYPNIITGGKWSPGGLLVFVSDHMCSFRMGTPGVSARDPGGGWKEISAILLSPFELNRWYHLAVTFKRPHITTYVDGKPVAQATWDFPVGYSDDLIIGRWGGAKACHQGLIDEVKIFNRALTADEIAGSYAKEAPRRKVTLAAGEKPYEIIPESAQRGPAFVKLENKFVKLEINERARLTSLTDKRTGKEILARSLPLAAIRIGDKTIRRCRCSYQDGKLTIQFGKNEATVVMGLTARDRYVCFEVLSVQGEDVEQLTFLTLQVQPSEYTNPMSSLAADEDFGVCVRALNLQTLVTIGGRPPMLQAMGYEEYGIVGAKAALVACPMDQMRPALQEVVKREGLPYSTLGGPWSLDAKDTQGSYLFARVSEANVDEWIALAKRAGFTHIHLHGWWQTLGHYEPRANLFPNGLEGMKACVKKIHGAGLKAGMHTLTGCISTTDSWVTPVPDKRLKPDASYTLAEAMGENSTTIHTLEKPERHDVIWSYSGGGNVIRIGEELIQYSAISYEPPYGFLECTRGAFKTKASAHPKGAAADHLQQRYLAFYPDENSTLVGEVADCIAHVYNTCEMDQIYMDGAEGMRGWHPVAVMRRAIYDRLKRPALVEASSWGNPSWPFHSRIGAWDHPKWGLKRFTDMHCEQIPRYRKGGLLQAQLGWWVIGGPTGYCPAEMPDEMEYFCCKTLAHDVPISIQGVYAGHKPWNRRQNEYLTIAGRYERLRLANYFSESVKERLREPRKEFRLTQAEDGEWRFLPTDYIKHKVTGLDSGANTWTINNRFAKQPLKMRIQALYAAMPYDSTSAQVITSFTDAKEFTIHRDAGGVTHALETSTEQVKVGKVSARFSAKSTRDSREGGWARAGMVFTPYLSIRPCDAVGLWIHGDAKGEILNVQFVTPREYMHCYAEQYVKIDFKGWRYVQLLFRERDSSHYHDYEWPYFAQHGIFRTRLDTAHVSEMNLYFNNLPPNDTATVYLSPIKALRTAKVSLQNPAVEVNGQKLMFPVTLQSESYIELESSSDCRVYDDHCAPLQRMALGGAVPLLAPGENTLTFTCEGTRGFPARANVTVITTGPEFRGRKPDSEINKRFLREEYELPRTICTLDGKENQWHVLCRPDCKSARLAIELHGDEVSARDEEYNAPSALTIESFDDLSFFADSPENQYAKYVHDSEHKGVATKPGVTQQLSPSTEIVKVGKASACYSATSTRSDNIGWSARGRRFAQLLDSSAYGRLGFWLYGDAKGESFKLQLRDNTGAWHDMVTRIDFAGWRYVEFDLTNAKLDLSKIEYLIIYYNGIPGGETVMCYVDDVRALPERRNIQRPELNVSGQRLVFPVVMFEGDRLVFKSMDECRLYRKDQDRPETVRPEGTPPTLNPGTNRVTLGLGADSPTWFCLTVSLAKIYP